MKMRLKLLLFFILFCFFTLLRACAQTEILPSPAHFRDDADWFFIGMNPNEVKILEIRAKDLIELKKEDMSAYSKLETVLITFTEDPEAPFSKKQLVIEMVEKNLQYLVELKECPSLKNIALQVGEMLFIRENEKLSKKEADALNLKRAGKAYAEIILKILPKVKIYAHNWGW